MGLSEEIYNIIKKIYAYNKEKDKFIKERNERIRNILYKKFIKNNYNLASLIKSANKFLGISNHYINIIKSVETDFTKSYYRLHFYGHIDKINAIVFTIEYPRHQPSGITIELKIKNDHCDKTIKFNYRGCYKQITCVYDEIHDYFKVLELKEEYTKLNKQISLINEEIHKLEDDINQNIKNSYK